MKVKVEDINDSYSLTLKGDEEWLGIVYEFFAPPVGAQKPLLSGQLRIQKEIEGVYKVTGSLAYSPFVNCSRCEDPIAWPLQVSVDTRFLDQEYTHKPNVNLKESDLEVYQIVEDALDIGQVVIDAVQTELPLRLVREDEKTGRCLLCDKNVSDSVAYVDEQQPESDNPFQKLKGLLN